MLEVLPRGVNKGVGVARMLDHLGVAPSEARARDSTRLAVGALRLDAVCAPQVLAIGDAENDLEMLRLVGTSVAMGNASPEVQARAPADRVVGASQWARAPRLMRAMRLSALTRPSPALSAWPTS